MKNYPEYPDDIDHLFREMGEEYGVKDYNHVLKARELACEICDSYSHYPEKFKLLIEFIRMYEKEISLSGKQISKLKWICKS